jgi:hypothetical protein
MMFFGMQSAKYGREFRRKLQSQSNLNLRAATLLNADPSTMSPECRILQQKVARGYKSCFVVAMVAVCYFVIVNIVQLL